MTAAQLIAFEKRVADAFAAKRIHAPIHLSSDGQAEPLIEIFKQVRPQDWVFSGWRSHFHALLKDIDPEWVFEEILAGRSMALTSKQHNFLCSSIVGGILPIACGVALGIKRKEESWNGLPRQNSCNRALNDLDENGSSKAKVWVFIGDMTARTGLFHEFEQYVTGHDLPVQVVIEDNGLSTNAVTWETWGCSDKYPPEYRAGGTRRYEYQRTYPHVGLAQRINF